jgi:hypothetical protein
VFRAAADPHARILYRASALARILGCSTSAVTITYYPAYHHVHAFHDDGDDDDVL